MDNTNGNIESLLEKAEAYGSATYELFKLKSIDKYSDVLSSLVARAAVVLVLLISVILFSVGMAFWLGEIFEKNYFGFFAVASFYIAAGVVLYIFRNRWIKIPVSNSIISQAMN